MVFAKMFSAATFLAIASLAVADINLSSKFLTSTSHSGAGSPDPSQSYYPNSMVCGLGTVCDSACGTGFSDCSSTDGYQHCYNQTAGATCCSDGTSCDSGWYCSSDSSSITVCCPNGMASGECAQPLGSNSTIASTASSSIAASSTAASSTDASSTSTGSASSSNATPNPTSSSSTTIRGSNAGAPSLLAMLGALAAAAVFL